VPELPEVETIVRDLRPLLTGRRFERAVLSHDDVLRGVTAKALTKGLAGRIVVGMTRRAKHAVIELGTHRLVVQPGMSGVLMVHEGPLEPKEAKYAVLRVALDDGRELVYRDVRRLGTLLLLDAAAWAAYDADLGAEPLDPAFTAEQFYAELAGSKQAIKKLIMDQKVVVGIGNIYANEALFASGIDPSKPGAAVSLPSATRLLAESRRILQAAIDNRGTTFRDYRTGTGGRGDFESLLKVYGREGEPCVTCGTRLAGTHEIDARATVFCHRCQS
jgi:formamidopyrimidine-DNA glycosylase